MTMRRKNRNSVFLAVSLVCFRCCCVGYCSVFSFWIFNFCNFFFFSFASTDSLACYKRIYSHMNKNGLVHKTGKYVRMAVVHFVSFCFFSHFRHSLNVWTHNKYTHLTDVWNIMRAICFFFFHFNETKIMHVCLALFSVERRAHFRNGL